MARSGPIRIGSTFSLREEFYSAMWLYQFKADYILCLDPADMVENMNKPNVNEDIAKNATAPDFVVNAPDKDEKGNN